MRGMRETAARRIGCRICCRPGPRPCSPGNPAARRPLRTDKTSAKAIGVAWCRRQFCPKTFRLGWQHDPSLRVRRIALASQLKIEYREARYATISKQGNSVTAVTRDRRPQGLPRQPEPLPAQRQVPRRCRKDRLMLTVPEQHLVDDAVRTDSAAAQQRRSWQHWSCGQCDQPVRCTARLMRRPMSIRTAA